MTLSPRRSGRRPCVGWLAAAFGLAGLACHRHAPPPPAPPKPGLGPIQVDDLSPRDEGPSSLHVPAIEDGLRRRLLATGLFSSDARDAGAAASVRVRATVGVETVTVGPKGEARAQIRLLAESRPTDAPGALEFDLAGQGVAPFVVPVRPSLDALVLRVAGDLVDGFAARRRLMDGPASAVHAALASDGGELREEAIRVVGERQLRDEAPLLLRLLADPDEPTRDAALGALIALRDRRAVAELTRTRSLHDRHEMQKIIEAIAILGGEEAEDYLSFVAATHDDDEIRAAAAAARARLARRKGELDAAVTPQPTAN